jgi:serine/threonine protein kinase
VQFVVQIKQKDGRLGLRHFRPIRPLGSGDTGSVHLVELKGTKHLFAMKAMDKQVMVNRNKVSRGAQEPSLGLLQNTPRDPLVVLDVACLLGGACLSQSTTFQSAIHAKQRGPERMVLLSRGWVCCRYTAPSQKGTFWRRLTTHSCQHFTLHSRQAKMLHMLSPLMQILNCCWG